MPGDQEDLRAILFDLRLTVNTLTGAVDALKESLTKTVSVDKYEALKADVDKLNSYLEWGIRIVIGAVLLALLGLILVQNGGPS